MRLRPAIAKPCLAIWDMMVRVDYRVVGKNYIDTLNIASLPVSTTLNGNVTFNNENWRVQLWGRNLTDDDTPRIAEWHSDYNINPNGSVRSFSVLPREGIEVGGYARLHLFSLGL